MGLVNSTNSSVVFDDNHFIQLSIKNITDVALTFNNYSEIASQLLGDLSTQQAHGLGCLSFGQIIPFYLNLPNCNRASFFAINDTITNELVKRYPYFMQPFQLCQQIKAELAEWNPSFTEAALLTGILFITSYSGNDPDFRNYQQQMTNACNLILWKLSRGDIQWYDKIQHCFRRVSNLLEHVKVGLRTAMTSGSQTGVGFSEVALSIAQAEEHGKVLVEAYPKDFVDSDDI